MSWCRWQGTDLLLELRVQPRASRNEVTGLHDGALRVRVTAPPVDSRANEALCRWLAEDFGVPLAAVTVLRGGTSRSKLARISAPRRAPAWYVAQGGEWPPAP
ncbi:MAG: DUF167 domain-containing protein [Gammaproteobacteria bacterium]